jgi:hypothetical protein
MDITLSHVTGLNLIQHKSDSINYYTTLLVTTNKGEVRIELFSEKGIQFILGDKDYD